MGRKSQRKGRAAELELAEILRSYGYPVEAATPLNYGTIPDLTGLPNVHIECKRHEQLRIPDWMRQATADAERFRDGMPCVFFRRSREPWRVCIGLDDFMTLYKPQKATETATKEGMIIDTE